MSAYMDAEFAAFWNDRAGPLGEPYKRHVLDPIMLDMVKPLQGKSVLDLGCGNGYLAPRFIAEGVSHLTLMDISPHNLHYAQSRAGTANVTFVQHDATQAWPVTDNQFDVIYSNMMLNEVENISTPLREAFRVLKPGGVLAVSVTHPAWDLYVYAQEQAGQKSEKLHGLGNYFRRGYCQFSMGFSNSNPDLAKRFGDKAFMVEHYQRPLGDYFAALTEAGFQIARMLEPELTPDILKDAPRMAAYAHHPVGLIFHAVKT